jgi:hypothetical protein
MHTNPEDLNALEQQLASWKPDPTGLDSDAMLFAAGRASAKYGLSRFVWPLWSFVLLGVAGTFAILWHNERTEKQLLTERLQQQSNMPAISGSLPSTPIEPQVSELAPNSLLATHRALETGLESWSPVSTSVDPHHASPSPNVLRVGQWGTLLD